MTTIEIAAIAAAVTGWTVAAILYRKIRRRRARAPMRYNHPMNDYADEIAAHYRNTGNSNPTFTSLYAMYSRPRR